MAKTFTEQADVPTTDWTADQEGMHAHLPFDLVRWTNNLVASVNPHAHFFHGASDDANGRLTMDVPGGSREVFMCQIAVGVPPWAGSMRWTAGVAASAGSIQTATVYVSPYPYTGVGSDNTGVNSGAFDLANFAHGYGVSAISLSVSTGSYAVADDSSTGIAKPTDHAFTHNESYGQKLVAYVVVTITTDSSDSTVNLRDFTCWFQP